MGRLTGVWGHGGLGLTAVLWLALAGLASAATVTGSGAAEAAVIGIHGGGASLQAALSGFVA